MPKWVSRYARGGSARKASARKVYVVIDAVSGHLAANGWVQEGGGPRGCGGGRNAPVLLPRSGPLPAPPPTRRLAPLPASKLSKLGADVAAARELLAQGR